MTVDELIAALGIQSHPMTVDELIAALGIQSQRGQRHTGHVFLIHVHDPALRHQSGLGPAGRGNWPVKAWDADGILQEVTGVTLGAALDSPTVYVELMEVNES